MRRGGRAAQPRFEQIDMRVPARADVQADVEALRARVTTDNFKEVGDFAGYLQEFHALNGFGFDGVDYGGAAPAAP